MFLRGCACLALLGFALCGRAIAQPSAEASALLDGGPPAAGAPAPAAASGTRSGINYGGQGVPIDRAIEAINRQAGGRSIAARGSVPNQRVNVILRNATFEQAVQTLSNQQPGWVVHRPEDQPNVVEIWDQASYAQQVLPKLVRLKVFVPRNINAEEAAKAVQGVLTQNVGSVAFDARTNKVLVTDQPYVLEIVQRLIEQIDVDYVTRVFYITNADVTAIADKLRNMRSSQAAPDIEVDEKTHQIIVRDRYETIRKMEQIVDTLDVGPDLRVYDINNIGVEGADADALREALEKIITKDAFMQINNLQGRLVLQDIPEVHEKVEKLLAALDQPVKQVLLQIEIIETDFSAGFNYSIDYTFSKDLFGSVIDGLTTYQGGGSGEAGASNGAQQTNPAVAGYTGVPIPVSSRGGASVNRGDLGFLDFRREFPITSVGGSGINTRQLTRNAFVTLQAAMSDTRTRVLQQPQVQVANQKLVSLNVGQEIPYFTGGNGYVNNVNNNGQNVSSVAPEQNRVKVGVILDITPVIGNNGLVTLEVSLSNDSAFFNNVTFAGAEYTAVGLNKQEINTTLVVPSGETRVIGGLLTDSKSETKAGVPYLTNIPVVGPMLFGSYNKPADQNRRRNLLVFMTPTIIEEKPTDLAKYRGRTVVDETVETLTTPTATLTDLAIDPMPRTLELPPPNAFREKTSMLPESWEPPTSSASRLPATLESAAPAPLDLDPRYTMPPGAEVPEPTPVQSGSLRRMKVTDRATSTATAYMPRIPAPSGSMTGGVGLNPAGMSTTPYSAPAVTGTVPLSTAPNIPSLATGGATATPAIGRSSSGVAVTNSGGVGIGGAGTTGANTTTIAVPPPPIPPPPPETR